MVNKRKKKGIRLCFLWSYTSYYFRFANSLVEAKTIRIKKDTYVGICQGLNNIFNFSAAALCLWYCISSALSFFTYVVYRYGMHLTRTDCSNYSSGSTFVVGWWYFTWLCLFIFVCRSFSPVWYVCLIQKIVFFNSISRVQQGVYLSLFLIFKISQKRSVVESLYLILSIE